MRSIKYHMLSFALAAALTNSAYAADTIIDQDPTPSQLTPVPHQTSGWYIGMRIGAAFADRTEFDALGESVESSYDTGYTLSGAIGREFLTNGVISTRLEGEIGYSSFDVDSHNIVGAGNFSGGNALGSTNALYGLANGYVDFNLGFIAPYVSGGVGYASVDFDNHGVVPAGPELSDSGGGLAWQLGAGVGVSMTDTIKLDLGYRYVGVGDVSLTAVDGTSSNVELRHHQITLGIRKAF